MKSLPNKCLRVERLTKSKQNKNRISCGLFLSFVETLIRETGVPFVFSSERRTWGHGRTGLTPKGTEYYCLLGHPFRYVFEISGSVRLWTQIRPMNDRMGQ